MRPRLLSLGLMIAVAPAVAIAEQVFANVSGCERLAGQIESADDVLIWTGETFEFWESTCPIMDTRQIATGGTLLVLECSGEGDTWESFYVIEATDDSDRFVVYPQEYPEMRTEISACK